VPSPPENRPSPQKVNVRPPLRRPGTLGTALLYLRHHGSAGSNMVARYLSSLHTRSVSDLFTASQMTLDCARHFDAITDLTDFVHQVERAPRKQWDELIRRRMTCGNLPTFGHPEIAVAGCESSLGVRFPACHLSLSPPRSDLFHHSLPIIPGSARDGKPRSFLLCFVLWIVVPMLPYSFLTYSPYIPSRQLYMSSIVLVSVMAYLIRQCEPPRMQLPRGISPRLGSRIVGDVV
jgi:hypothetical protein